MNTSEDIYDLPPEATIADADTLAARRTLVNDWNSGVLKTAASALWRIEFLHLWSRNGETPETDNNWREFVRHLILLEASESAATQAKYLTPTSQPNNYYSQPSVNSAREESL